jgi:hypothetical protein
MVMGMQTIAQQAGYRVEGILNDYPIDYYDNYAGRVAQVTAEQVLQVMRNHATTEKFVIVVVGPAEKLKDALGQFGPVEVRPMPSQRSSIKAKTPELLHPTKP